MTQKPKIRVGIVGEHPNNDAQALKNLLQPAAAMNVEFVVMSKNSRGGQLDSAKFLNVLRAEFRAEKPKHIILVRDLDGPVSDPEKLRERDSWFEKANKEVENCGIFFLAIHEMEALVLADIAGFNKFYGLKTKFAKHPMSVEKPKEFLQKLTEKAQKGKYSENDAPIIFQNLNLKTVAKSHSGDRSFAQFAQKLVDGKLILE